MWPDRVSNPGPLTYESGALPTALRGPAKRVEACFAASLFTFTQLRSLFGIGDLLARHARNRI